MGFQIIEDDGQSIKPTTLVFNDPQKIVYELFVNKYEGDVGQMKRRHIHADSVVLIGKEANNIDDQPLDIWQAQVFLNKQDIMDKILELTPETARKVGLKFRGTLKKDSR